MKQFISEYYLSGIVIAGILTAIACPAVKSQASSLFINAGQIGLIKENIQKPGTHHADAFSSLKWRVDQNDLRVYGQWINGYNRSYRAQEEAFLCLMSPGLTDQKRYADMAFQTIYEIYNTPEQISFPDRNYGLSRAMMQLGLALPYAWCRGYWTDEQKTYVHNRIIDALDSWLTYDHPNFGDVKGSNWVAVCRGGELILLLAAGEKENRADRYKFLTDQLITHMQNGYGDLGVSQEGMGYTEYGGAFLLKAAFAAASTGDSTLFREALNHAWWKLAMYAESFQPHDRKFLMTGVAGSSNNDEGWASLLLNLVPAEERPCFLWWYDRHMGQMAPGDKQDKFDPDRAGTIWSVLYYPASEKPKDPTYTYPAGVMDKNGYCFFRNRWKDENDILFSIAADGHHHAFAWDQPEVFALNLMAHNSRYIGGPSKMRDNHLYSTLLVDSAYNIKNSVELTGNIIHRETGLNSSEVAIDGGMLYKTLGLDMAHRFCAIKFLDHNRAIICLRDVLRDDSPHLYTWQLNLGDENSNDNIEVTANDNHFSLMGRNGQIDGWIVQPEEFTIANTTDPFQINVRGKNTEIMVVLYLHKDFPARISFIEKGQQKKIQLLDYSIWFDRDSENIKIE